MKRIHSFFLILLLMMTLFSGCWDWKELNTLTIVSGIGLDQTKERGKICVTAQVIKPSALAGGGMGGGGNGESGGGGAGGVGAEAQAVRVITSTGETVFQAIRNLTTRTSHRIFLSHTHIVVIGRDAAEQGVYRFLDFFTRDPEPRPMTNLLIAEGKAGDIMRYPDGVESIPAMGIFRAVRTAGEHAFAPEISLHESNRRLASETTELIAPLTHIYEEEGVGGQKKKRIDIEGTAVFRGDRMVGKLGLEETRGLHWILGEVETGVIVIEQGSGKESLEVVKTDSKITPEIRKEGLAVKVSVDVDTNLASQQSRENLTSTDNIPLLEKKQAAVIRNEITSAVQRAQELKADIFGFGEEFQRKYPEQWQELKPRWKELFPGIEVQLDVKANLRETGIIREPIYQQR